MNVTKDKLKVLDLFSGIGMFSYGLEQTNLYQTIAFCEWDGPCRDVLRKHWPDVSIFGDISSVEYQRGCVFEVLEDLSLNGVFTVPDVITGGFPCQDISNSGNKSGLAGQRSSLWYQMLRLITEIKPKGVIIENVSALSSRGVETVLQGLHKVGYDAEWHCIPAAYCGAVHKRDRMFILAYSPRIGQQRPWEPLKPFYQEETRNREANIIKYALQRSALPYVCGDHPKCSGGLDRLKQLGNTVYWPIVERLGYHLYRNVT